MEVAFNKLFMVPGGSYAYPWESPYLGKDATLFKESTLDVRERYAKYGFEAEMKGHFPGGSYCHDDAALCALGRRVIRGVCRWG